MAVDGVAAARTLQSFTNIKGGYCLHYVWQAYKANGASTGRSAGTAYEAWQRSDGQHADDRNPPAGVPVFWGPKASSAAGDVVISLGGGRVAATDYPNYGVVGTCTIDQRERQIGRPYLGWTEAIFDQRISYGQPTSTIHQEEDMPTVEEILDYNIVRQGPGATGTTNLRQLIAWYDSNLGGLNERILERIEQKANDLAQHVTAAVTAAVKSDGATVDPDVVRNAVTAAIESALAGTSLDPQVTAKAVRAELTSNPLK